MIPLLDLRGTWGELHVWRVVTCRTVYRGFVKGISCKHVIWVTGRAHVGFRGKQLNSRAQWMHLSWEEGHMSYQRFRKGSHVSQSHSVLCNVDILNLCSLFPPCEVFLMSNSADLLWKEWIGPWLSSCKLHHYSSNGRVLFSCLFRAVCCYAVLLTWQTGLVWFFRGSWEANYVANHETNPGKG